MKRSNKDVLIFGTISFEGIFCKANSKLSQISRLYLKDIFNDFFCETIVSVEFEK